MAVQNSTNNSTVPFVRSGISYSKEDQVLLQDAGRSADLAPFTLLAKVAASGKWVPFTDETATDGTAIPSAVYLGDTIAQADIVAGDVTGFGPILVGGACTVDDGQLVIENSKTLGTVIGATSVNARTVNDELRNKGIFVEDTVDIDEFEN